MSTTSPKKPRARKLEKDRADNKAGGLKKGSARHTAAKKAASDKRKATATKAAKSAKATRDQTLAARAKGETDDRKPRSKRSDAPASKSAPSRGRATSNDRRERDSYDDRPARSSRPSSRDDRPTRGSRDDRPARYNDERPSRYSDDRPARSSRPSTSRDDRPTRSSRDDRPTRGSRDDRPARYNDDRPARYSDDRPARSSRPTRDDAPARSTRGSRDDRPSRSYNDERPARAPKREFSDAPKRAPRKDYDDAPRKRAPREIETPELTETDLEEIQTSEWNEVGVSPELIAVLKRTGLDAPFAIQAKALPTAIEGKDVLGRAATGSGKTLAFGLAMLTRLAHRKATPYSPLGLVMVPTRELAAQVCDALMPLAQSVGLDIRLIAGGMPYAKQIDALRRSVPILVATPGRLNDLVEQGHVKLNKVEISILDEADQMCDMGFMPQIVEVLSLIPKESQHLLFSATLDGDVDKIVRKYLHEPVTFSTASSKASVSTMEHHVLVAFPEDKSTIISQIAAREGKTILFARTQAGVDRIAKDLAFEGIPTSGLHGGKSQAVRTRTLAEFKDGITNVLVATDVAARGIHVDNVSLVVHIDPPNDPKDYLHRAGRTARAGEDGAVVTMVTPRQQKSVLSMMSRAGVNPDVSKVKPMSRELIEITGAQEPSGEPWHAPKSAKTQGNRGGGRRSGGQGRSGGYRGSSDRGGSRSGGGSRRRYDD